MSRIAPAVAFAWFCSPCSASRSCLLKDCTSPKVLTRRCEGGVGLNCVKVPAGTPDTVSKVSYAHGCCIRVPGRTLSVTDHYGDHIMPRTPWSARLRRFLTQRFHSTHGACRPP